jgi:hypothetical protein
MPLMNTISRFWEKYVCAEDPEDALFRAIEVRTLELWVLEEKFGEDGEPIKAEVADVA